MAYATKVQGNALGLSDDESKAIEQTRQRLYQLTNSIQSLRQSVLNSNPLPPRQAAPSSSSLHAQYQILLRNLQSLLDVLTENAVPFAHTSVHPAVNFPGRTQESVLLTLLRKKREPAVEERVERGLETTADLRAALDANGDLADGIRRLEEVWYDLREWTTERVASYVRDGEAADVYTKKEREAGVENVRSGLRRALEEPEEDDEEESDEEDMDDDELDDDVLMGDTLPAQGQRQALPEPELLFWFAARGDYDLPPNVELEKDAARRARLTGGGMPRM